MSNLLGKDWLIERALPPRENYNFRRPLYFKGDFMPENSEVLVASYPYAVSDWVIQCIRKLINLGHDSLNYESSLDCIENIGTNQLNGVAPRLVTCHLPYWSVRRNDFARYIYIIRNPRDTLVVYYLNSLIYNQVQTPFDNFFQDFIQGNLNYGNYFDHIRSWYKSQDPNIFFLNYEKMHVNPRRSVLEMAEFLGPRYFNLCLDDSVMDRILQYSNLDYRMFTVEGDSLMNCFQQLVEKHSFVYQPVYDQFQQGLLPVEFVGSCVGFWRRFSYITDVRRVFLNLWIRQEFSHELYRNFGTIDLLDMLFM